MNEQVNDYTNAFFPLSSFELVHYKIPVKKDPELSNWSKYMEKSLLHMLFFTSMGNKQECCFLFDFFLFSKLALLFLDCLDLNNHTETILITTLLGQKLWHISGSLIS